MIEVLRHMNEEIEDNIYRLNCGGCGVYAWMVARALERLPIIAEVSCTVTTNCRTPADLDAVYHKLKQSGGLYIPRKWWANGVHFDHIVVQYRPKGSETVMVVDSEGVCEREEWHHHNNSSMGRILHPGKIGWQVMRGLTRRNDHYGWNTSYSRSQGRKLAGIIKRHLG